MPAETAEVQAPQAVSEAAGGAILLGGPNPWEASTGPPWTEQELSLGRTRVQGAGSSCLESTLLSIQACRGTSMDMRRPSIECV